MIIEDPSAKYRADCISAIESYMNIKAYILHLARATDRRKQVDRLKERSPVPVEVIDAIDGTTLDSETMQAAYQTSQHQPRYPFKLRTAEIACFLSHRKCWQTLLDQNLDGALILEDDVELDGEIFPPAFELALQSFSLDSYVRFPEKCREVPASTLVTSSTHRLIVPRVIGLGMIGQLVGRNAARTLLEKTHTFDRPVDSMLQMSWLTGVWPVSIYPSGISEESEQLGGSRISKQKSWGEILQREVLRPWYRRKLAALAVSNRLTRDEIEASYVQET